MRNVTTALTSRRIVRSAGTLLGSRPVLRLVLSRIVLLPFTVLGVVLVTFVLTRIVPADPAYALSGPTPTPESIAAINKRYGFDLPIATQFWHYLGRLAHGDLGQSLTSGQSVASALFKRFPSTLELVVLGMLIAIVFGVAAGAISARRRGGKLDGVLRGASFLGLALPEFWLGIVLAYVFFFRLNLLPAPTGQLDPKLQTPPDVTGAAFLDSLIAGQRAQIWSAFRHLILPVLTIAIVSWAPFARLTRSAMSDVLQQDWVRFSQACGVPRRTVARYVLRASMPSVVTFVGVMFVLQLGGVVLVETVFSWGGVAQYVVHAIQSSDYDVVQGFVLIVGVLAVLVFLLVDIAYLMIDPRARRR